MERCLSSRGTYIDSCYGNRKFDRWILRIKNVGWFQYVYSHVTMYEFCSLCLLVSCLATFSPWRWKQYVPSKRHSTSTGLQGATPQKSALFMHGYTRIFLMRFLLGFVHLLADSSSVASGPTSALLASESTMSGLLKSNSFGIDSK
jgi:hypothetical protein